jgi:predicted lysophospholipase L1 biosynthesis ABC-type transport system permease subunit
MPPGRTPAPTATKGLQHYEVSVAYHLPERGVFGTRLSVLLNLKPLTMRLRLVIIGGIIAVAVAIVAVISLDLTLDNAMPVKRQARAIPLNSLNSPTASNGEQSSALTVQN